MKSTNKARLLMALALFLIAIIVLGVLTLFGVNVSAKLKYGGVILCVVLCIVPIISDYIFRNKK